MGDSHELPADKSVSHTEQREAVGVDTQPGRLVQMTRFIKDHRLYYSGVLLAMVLAGFFGYGVASKWGSSQWGPMAAWVAGALTLAAVVVALREASRSQFEREIDLELDRRRECIRAVSDVWAAVGEMRLLSIQMSKFFSSFDYKADPDTRRKRLDEQRPKFFVPWQATYIPARFFAQVILHETRLNEPLDSLHSKVSTITTRTSDQFDSALRGMRQFDWNEWDIWNEILNMRDAHMELTRKAFSLDRHSVRDDLQRRRSLNSYSKRPPAE